MARNPGSAPPPDALQVEGDEPALLRPLAVLLVQLARAEIARGAGGRPEETGGPGGSNPGPHASSVSVATEDDRNRRCGPAKEAAP